MRRTVVAIFLLVILAGCAGLPSIDPPIGSKPSADGTGPTVPQVITHIQCEIWDLMNDDKNAELEDFRISAYVVTANLTLDVTNNQSFSPTINLISLQNPITTNVTTTIGGQLSGTQHRSVNLAFSLLLDPSEKGKGAARDSTCASQAKSEGGLQGTLGLKELVMAGIKSVDTFMFSSPTNNQAPKNANTIPTFGSTIDFTIVKSVGGGPTWNLTHFKGPSGSSNLLNYMRTNKDTLTIAFAKAGVAVDGQAPQLQSYNIRRPGTLSGTADTEQAARAAQDNVTRMILQRLIPQ